ncbi:hypothetical protein AKJ16_DCAP24651 [Drosera capensis]
MCSLSPSFIHPHSTHSRLGFTGPCISIYIAAVITSPPAPPPLYHLRRRRILERSFEYVSNISFSNFDRFSHRRPTNSKEYALRQPRKSMLSDNLDNFIELGSFSDLLHLCNHLDSNVPLATLSIVDDEFMAPMISHSPRDSSGAEGPNF